MLSAAEQKARDADTVSEPHPLRVSGGVFAGQILTKQIPQIPTEALKDRPSGTMVIAIVVDPTGHVVKSSVISGAEVLRPYCLDAINQWTFRPFLLDGRPVFVQTTVTTHMHFSTPP